MPNPKRQHSKQRSRKRRTHQRLCIPQLNACPQCHKPILSHRVCPFCGYYKGRPVVVIEPEENKEQTTK